MKYRYFNDYGLATLKDMRLRVSPLGELNDPFECRPVISSSGTDDDVRNKMADPAFADTLCRHAMKLGIVTDEATFRYWYANYRTDVAAVIRKHYTSKSVTPERFVEMAARQVGVICFSELHDNVLMWSHYANKHKGVVIGFDDSALPGIHRVLYDDQRYNLSPVFSASTSDKMIDALRTKATKWAYEREHRVFVPWSRCIEAGGHHFIEFDSICVREIFLGCRIDAALAGRVVSTWRTSYPHSQLKRMAISENGFEMHEVAI